MAASAGPRPCQCMVGLCRMRNLTEECLEKRFSVKRGNSSASWDANGSAFIPQTYAHSPLPLCPETRRVLWPKWLRLPGGACVPLFFDERTAALRLATRGRRRPAATGPEPRRAFLAAAAEPCREVEREGRRGFISLRRALQHLPFASLFPGRRRVPSPLGCRRPRR